jgi:hypothetical protein
VGFVSLITKLSLLGPSRGSDRTNDWPCAYIANYNLNGGEGGGALFSNSLVRDLYINQFSSYNKTPFTQINWDDEPSGMQKIRIIGFFFENRLHWHLEVRLLLFTVCTCI